MGKPLPPILLLEQYRAKFSRFFDIADDYVKDQQECPAWCHIPMGAALAYIQFLKKNPTPTDVLDASVLTAVYKWRLTKGIYRFDSDFADILLKTKAYNEVPTDILFQLPAYCVYIDTTTFNLSYIGLFVHLEYDSRFPDIPELRYILVSADMSCSSGYLPLINGTIDEAIQKFDEDNNGELSSTNKQKSFKSVITTIIQITLSLCATKSVDISTQQRQVTTKIQSRFAPSPSKWEVGVRIGSAIRNYRLEENHTSSSKTGKTVRPHIRAAHWHTYRIGKGKSDSYVKWLFPINVKVDENELPTVIRYVKD